MPNNLLVIRSPAATLDPAAHIECLEFIRYAIATADRTTARQIAAVVKEVYESGHADRAEIWADLSQAEQNQFKELLAPPPLACDFARRIREALGYQSPAVAGAIQTELEWAIDAGSLTAADGVAVLGAAEFGEFDRLQS